MDHIYPTKDYKVYKIKDEAQKMSESVLSSGIPTEFEDIATAVGVSQEELKKICIDVCSSYENYGLDEPCGVEAPFSLFPNEGLELNFVKAMRQRTVPFTNPQVQENQTIQKFQGCIKPGDELKAFKDSVITIRFYSPFKYWPGTKNNPRFHQEFLVLGSNLLTELRDRFYCPCNFAPFKDISDDPHNIRTFTSTNPGFFFIHDTFYNDTRNPDNPDYSGIIVNWYKKQNYAREFKTAVMQDTKFEDLQIRIGYPCVYQHQGACEHIFCIVSVDLLNNSHSLNGSDYPLLHAARKSRTTLCDICGKSDAMFIVTNCSLHVIDPMKLCYNCFFYFHYENDGVTKTCDFQAYRMHSSRPDS